MPPIDPALRAQLESRGMTQRIAELENPVKLSLTPLPSIPSKASIRDSLMATGLSFEKANQQAQTILAKKGAVPINDRESAMVNLSVKAPIGPKPATVAVATPPVPKPSLPKGPLPLVDSNRVGPQPATPFSVTPKPTPAPIQGPSVGPLVAKTTPQGDELIAQRYGNVTPQQRAAEDRITKLAISDKRVEAANNFIAQNLPGLVAPFKALAQHDVEPLKQFVQEFEKRSEEQKELRMAVANGTATPEQKREYETVLLGMMPIGEGAAAAKVIKNGVKKLGKNIVNEIMEREGVNGLKALEFRLNNLTEGEKALGKMEAMFEAGREQKPSLFDRVKKVPLQIQTALESRYAPLTPFEKKVTGGVGELPLQNRVELAAGIPGKAMGDVKNYEDSVIKPILEAGASSDDFNSYLGFMRVMSRLGTGESRMKVGSWTLDEAKAGLEALKGKVGPEIYNQFAVQAVKYDKMMDQGLRRLVDAGVISEDGYKIIKANNDFYAKFKVLKYYKEASDGLKTGQSVSMGREEIIKAMKGIADDETKLQDLLSTGAESLYNARTQAEKNLVMKAFKDVAKQGEEAGIVTKIPEGGKLIDLPNHKDLDIVSVFENGVREDWAVPKEIAESMKGLNQEQADIFTKTLTQASRPFKGGVTVFNAGFQLVNALLADIPRNLIMFKYGNDAKSLLRFPADILSSYMSSFKGNFGKQNELYKAFLESGAANSTIAKEINPEAFASRLGKRSAVDTAKHYTIDNVTKFANAIEEGGKLLGIKRGLPAVKEGKITMNQLADEVRKYAGSPDFLRKGTMSQPLNSLFMFLNARIQGTSLDLKRLGGATGPKEAAQAWAKLSSVVGIPALTLSIINREKYAEDYDRLSEQEKNNNFIIFRDTFAQNQRGEMYREYWKIPKRETAKLFSNLIDAGVQFAYDHDRNAAKEYAIKFLEDVSPINFTGDTLSERVESVISGTNPLIKANVELGTNRNTFFHDPTVPETINGVPTDQLSPENQYYLKTPKFYQWLGKQMRQSPIKIQNYVSNMTGTLLSQAPWTSIINRFKGQGRLDLTKSEKEQAASILEALQAQGDKKIETNRKAQELFNEFGQLSKSEQVEKLKPLVKSGEVTKEIATRYEDLMKKSKLDWNESDYNMNKLQVTNGARAKEMYKLLQGMDEESRKNQVNEWGAKGLVSKNVKAQLKFLLKNPKQAAKILKMPSPKNAEKPKPEAKKEVTTTADGLKWEKQADGSYIQVTE